MGDCKIIGFQERAFLRVQQAVISLSYDVVVCINMYIITSISTYPQFSVRFAHIVQLI
jgi:hypothetical protein